MLFHGVQKVVENCEIFCIVSRFEVSGICKRLLYPFANDGLCMHMETKVTVMSNTASGDRENGQKQYGSSTQFLTCPKVEAVRKWYEIKRN